MPRKARFGSKFHGGNGAASPVSPLPLNRQQSWGSTESMSEDDLIGLLGAQGGDAQRGGAQPSIHRAVVKIFATFSEPNFTQPWANRPQQKGSGSGFIVSGRRILTNAHVTAYATSVEVRKHGDASKYPARVVAVSHEVDLCILTVDKEAFWSDATVQQLGASAGSDGDKEKRARSGSTSSAGHAHGHGHSRAGAKSARATPTPELSFGNLPRLGDGLFVLGYPLSSDTISVTAGVVSRFEFDTYAHSGMDNLTIITDSAINPGNSGGPAIDRHGACIGVAFQGLEGAEGIGYVIPIPVIIRFLEDVDKHGKVTGFGSLGCSVQSLENEALRESLLMPAHMTGVLINEVAKTTKLAKQLQAGDVLLAIDGRPIANDGTIALRGDERVPVAYVLTTKFVGATLALSILRAGAPQTLTIEVEEVPELVEHIMYDKRPSYIVVGGLLFTVLTRPYLERAFGEFSEPPMRLLALAQEGTPEFEGQQVVVLSEILSNPVNIGYEPSDFAGSQLKTVNGVKVKNLAHLAATLRDILFPSTSTDTTTAASTATTEGVASATPSPGPFLKFVFDDASTIVLPIQACKKATAEVLAQHAIPAAMSADMYAALNVPAPAPAPFAPEPAPAPAPVQVSQTSEGTAIGGAGSMPASS
jgi:S1-C subfamily serine protease